jgi:hypothetical protein
MSAFVKLNKQDAFVVPYTAHKSFSLISTLNSGSGGLDFLYGTRDRSTVFNTQESSNNGAYDRLVYDSVKHLYYSNFSSSLEESGSFENYNQSTLYFSKGIEENDGDHVFVFSLKRERFGEAINPGTFRFYSGSTFAIIDDAEGNLIMSSSTTIQDVYSATTVIHIVSESLEIDTIDTGTPFIQFLSDTTYGLDATYTLVTASYQGTLLTTPFQVNGGEVLQVVQPELSELDWNSSKVIRTFDAGTLNYVDNGGAGNDIEFIYTSSSINYTLLAPAKSFTTGDTVGNIYYPHGIAVVTNSSFASHLWYAEQYSSSFSWENTHTVFQHEYRCRVKESNLNYSQNPSIKSGSNGDVYDFATGSYFQPYVSTIGLYNDANELVAVGKLAQPVPKSRYTDMTFVVKFDS